MSCFPQARLLWKAVSQPLLPLLSTFLPRDFGGWEERCSFLP